MSIYTAILLIFLALTGHAWAAPPTQPPLPEPTPQQVERAEAYSEAFQRQIPDSRIPESEFPWPIPERYVRATPDDVDYGDDDYYFARYCPVYSPIRPGMRRARIPWRDPFLPIFPRRIELRGELVGHEIGRASCRSCHGPDYDRRDRRIPSNHFPTWSLSLGWHDPFWSWDVWAWSTDRRRTDTRDRKRRKDRKDRTGKHRD